MPDVETLGGRVRALADRLRNLTVKHRDPEAFYIERSELERGLRTIADELLAAPRRETARRPPAQKFEAGTIAGRDGRFVRVEIRRKRKELSA